VFLENVDRLIISPKKAKGLNFAIILNDLLDMGYHVEWRIVNPADYGMPQKRKRVFILAYRTDGTGQNYRVNGKLNFACKIAGRRGSMSKWIFDNGPFGKAFSAIGELEKKPELVPSLDYKFSSKSSPFLNAGYAWKQKQGNIRRNMFWTTKVKADYNGEFQTIRDIMVSKGEESYEDSYEVDEGNLQGWEYARAKKNEFRIRKEDKERWPELWETYRKCVESQDQSVWDEHRQKFIDTLGDEGSYKYEEGQMDCPDSIDKHSRTVVTAEIGKSASRARHLIKHDDGTYRTLFPIETERLNMFPDNWTKIEVNGKKIAASKRGFLMGNALVVGVIERLREPLLDLISSRNE
jgi:DNA (cytosine-5)-methyltransferase 1